MKPIVPSVTVSLLLALAACASPSVHTQVSAPAAPKAVETPSVPAALAAARKKPAPKELFEIVTVIDGDTIHITRNGKKEKLRLLSVDTEEKLQSGTKPDSTKPPTVFGEECAQWAQEFFAKLGHDGQPPRIGLLFPGGREQYDFYGRLLCHVILPDGTDYNLMLVEMGKSPYFSKYGYSEIEHEAFVAAQDIARRQQLGIWNPKTNVAATPGVPSARRPYDKLLPWWDARGEAVAAFHAARAKDAHAVCDTDDPESLAAAAAAGQEFDCFGEIAKVDEKDGGLTIHFRASQRDKAFVVFVPKDAAEAHRALDLAGASQEFRQNYLWFRTKVTADPKGYFKATSSDATRWRRAGPEPKMP